MSNIFYIKLISVVLYCQQSIALYAEFTNIELILRLKSDLEFITNYCSNFKVIFIYFYDELEKKGKMSKKYCPIERFVFIADTSRICKTSNMYSTVITQ